MHIKKKFLIGLSVLLLVGGCAAGETATDDYGFFFEDITESSGIDFVHEKTEQFDPKVDNIQPWLASTGAGVAVADYDQDGWMDLYFVNTRPGSQAALYRNNGDGTFTETAAEAGVADINQDGSAQTALWFDYTNNGYPDLFIGKWGKSQLFRNNGDGTFTDVTDEAGTDFVGHVNKAISIDYDRDGYLDLYLGCYFRDEYNLWDLDMTRIMHTDFERAVNGGRNVMFRNNGDGTFTDVSVELGVDDPGWTLATGAADLTGDGWPDLFNANDFGPDALLINVNGERFERITQSRGIGDDTFKGMNVDFADVFHDGNLAFYISNISKERYLLEGNQLWHKDASGKYRDRASEMGVLQAGFSWGARFLDVDNNGRIDLAVSNGFISANPDRDYWFDMGILATTPGNIVEDTRNWPVFEDKSMSGYEPKHLFLHMGDRYEEVAQQVGITFVDDGRGVAAVDLLNNGMLDLVYANQGAPARVYQNTVTNGNNWIKLHLIGKPPSNRDAVGARITFEVDGVQTVMERDGGNSHGAQSDPRIHFGLGEATHVDRMTIRWPSGNVQEWTQVEANRIWMIEEE